MNTAFNKMPKAADRIVYVRAVEVADLPFELQEQAEGLTQIFSVHRGNGERLALVLVRPETFLHQARPYNPCLPK